MFANSTCLIQIPVYSEQKSWLIGFQSKQVSLFRLYNKHWVLVTVVMAQPLVLSKVQTGDAPQKVEGCQVIIQTVRLLTMVGNNFEECHTPCMKKDSFFNFFLDFKKSRHIIIATSKDTSLKPLQKTHH
jgi:hypothetical protein